MDRFFTKGMFAAAALTMVAAQPAEAAMGCWTPAAAAAAALKDQQ